MVLQILKLYKLEHRMIFNWQIGPLTQVGQLSVAGQTKAALDAEKQ